MAKFFLRLLGPLIFGLIVYFFVNTNMLLQILQHLDFSFFIVALIFVPPLIWIRSLRWYYILALFDIFYSRWKCFKIYFIEMLAVMIVSSVGTFSKIAYLKRDGHGLLIPALTILADKYYDYLLPLLFGFLSICLIVLNPIPSIGVLLFFGITCILFTPMRTAFSLLPFRFFRRVFRKIAGTDKSIFESRLPLIQHALNLRTYLLSVAAFALYFICIYFVSKGLKLNLDFFQIILIMTITSLVSMVPISFLGIGTRDAGLIVVFEWFGRTPEEAVALSMALLMFRLTIAAMGAFFWIFDPMPLHEIRKIRES